MKDLLMKTFSTATKAFFANEKNNILANVAERNLCSQLGYYLKDGMAKTKLKDYHVDPEYNRNLGNVKTIFDSEEEEVITITCDLLVHSRGEIVPQDNLLALEMKKGTHSDAAKNDDRKRLRLLTRPSYNGVWAFEGELPEHVCGYILGVYMELVIRDRICIFEFYENGEKTSEKRAKF